eukprot:TRINITY_DN1497_c0_g1_i1.p1 TRINITY_DN1497_c0_g1~~TRINITY_DN1497_c0_g1_i1.p1  ORF type:complete len:472 (-),score=99.36 TRINITY_DN1497_c0_g1_i1:150-1520(-)
MALHAVSPLDGRYQSKVASLQGYFSESALFRYRTQIEVEYFLSLISFLPQLSPLEAYTDFPTTFREIYSKEKFGDEAVSRVKEIESTTNHDVKAVEYYVKEQLTIILTSLDTGLLPLREFVHFALTSQDINNCAIPLLLKEAVETQYLTKLNAVMQSLKTLAVENMDLPMLARTHGQPATPVRLGQALMVFVYRVEQQLKLLAVVPHAAKFGGATGGLSAHVAAFPDHDWISFANKFVASLGLEREQWTTQISNYDHLGALMDTMKRINTVLIGLCRDMWTYISLEYFKQLIKTGEIGSSAMPHKVNPIDFENAEGNLGIANSLFEHFASKLPISRLQRDLSDSTVLRNLGVPLGHTLIALQSLLRGFGKVVVNSKRIEDDLNDNYIVISEALQTILRRVGVDKPYELVKGLTRKGVHLSPETFAEFIDTLEVADEVKDELRNVSPQTFIGVVPKV